MKLRITTNSIRIRIRKSELAILSERHKIVDSVQFPSNDIFKFELAISNTKSEVTAELVDNLLFVFIPTPEAENWISTEAVGIETFIELNEEDKLHILIEKDFPCKDRPGEDKSDTFTELVEDKSSVC